MPAHTVAERAKRMTHEEVMERVLMALDALIEDRRLFNWQQEELSDRPGIRIRTFVIGTAAAELPEINERNGLPGRDELTIIVEHPTAEVGFAADREEVIVDGKRINLGQGSELGRSITIRWPHGVPLIFQSDTASTTVKVIESTRALR